MWLFKTFSVMTAMRAAPSGSVSRLFSVSELAGALLWRCHTLAMAKEVTLQSPSAVVCLFPLLAASCQGPDPAAIEGAKLLVASAQATALPVPGATNWESQTSETLKLIKYIMSLFKVSLVRWLRWACRGQNFKGNFPVHPSHYSAGAQGKSGSVTSLSFGLIYLSHQGFSDCPI